MRTYKTRIGCMAVFLLLMTGCGDKAQNINAPGSVDADTQEYEIENGDYISGGSIIKTTGDFIVDINDGDNDFDPFRMLNESDNLRKAESNAFKEAWSILDNAEWETAEVSMSRSADYRVKVVDKRDKEKMVTTNYYLWANPAYKSIELVDRDNTRYVLMKKPDSEKLYKFLTNRNLSDRALIK